MLQTSRKQLSSLLSPFCFKIIYIKPFPTKLYADAIFRPKNIFILNFLNIFRMLFFSYWGGGVLRFFVNNSKSIGLSLFKLFDFNKHKPFTSSWLKAGTYCNQSIFKNRILLAANFENSIIHKPSLGSREVPLKMWARSVQPF